MPVKFFHKTWESTEYTVLTHIGVWVKTQINILYPRCKFDISYTPIFVSFISTRVQQWRVLQQKAAAQSVVSTLQTYSTYKQVF